VAETLLGVSVWADMRDGTDQLDLLLTLGKRVGLTSILLATDGPLAAKTTTLPAADRSHRFPSSSSDGSRGSRKRMREPSTLRRGLKGTSSAKWPLGPSHRSTLR